MTLNVRDNLRVVVVCGGISSEREVSLSSGRSIYNALQKLGYSKSILFDLKDDNVTQLLLLKPDIVYIGLHGKGGEDGTIQGMLELAGIPYTGPGVVTSAVCMNKILTKRVLLSANLPTSPFLVYSLSDVCGRVHEIECEASKVIGYPMVLKSPCQGSSIGVVIVHSTNDFRRAVDDVFRYGDELLIEAFLDGIEVTLPILGNDDISVLPAIEIISQHEFYDYKAKYTKGLCRHIIPARLSTDSMQKVIKYGMDAYKVLGCKGLSRVDFIVDKLKGPVIIEVNTLPGMTDMSLFPDAANYVGISYENLVEMVLDYGLNLWKK